MSPCIAKKSNSLLLTAFQLNGLAWQSLPLLPASLWPFSLWKILLGPMRLLYTYLTVYITFSSTALAVLLYIKQNFSSHSLSLARCDVALSPDWLSGSKRILPHCYPSSTCINVVRSSSLIGCLDSRGYYLIAIFPLIGVTRGNSSLIGCLDLRGY